MALGGQTSKLEKQAVVQDTQQNAKGHTKRTLATGIEELGRACQKIACLCLQSSQQLSELSKQSFKITQDAQDEGFTKDRVRVPLTSASMHETSIKVC